MEVLFDLLQRLDDCLRVGIEMFVHRRPDDDDDVLGTGDGRGLGRRDERPCVEHLSEKLGGSRL